MGACDEDDGDIATQVASGSHAAFGSMYDRHAPIVHAYLARRAGDHDPDDLLSVVFLEAWRVHDRATLVDGSLRPWLLGIARNVTCNAWRSWRRHGAAVRRYQGLRHEPTADHADAVIRSVDQAGLELAVAEALSRLDAKLRDVSELCLLGGLSIAGAAAVLGIPEGTVKSRLSRARQRLARVLQTGELENRSTASGYLLGERPPAAWLGRTS